MHQQEAHHGPGLVGAGLLADPGPGGTIEIFGPFLPRQLAELAPVALLQQFMHLVHQQAIGLGMLLLIKEDRAPKKPQQAGPVAPVVVTPGPVFGVGAGFVAPLIQVHGRMADAHRHLGHEVLAVVEHQPKQGPLLGGGQQTKQAGEGIPQAVEAEVGAPGAHVAD